MKKQYPLLLILLLSLTRLNAQNERIVKFTFTSCNSLNCESIIVTSDSIFIKERGEPASQKIIKTETSAQQWAGLIYTIAEYKLNDLILLPSPTNRRSFDGADISSIKITTNKKEYDCGAFDGYVPNKKLDNLVKVLLEIKNQKPAVNDVNKFNIKPLIIAEAKSPSEKEMPQFPGGRDSLLSFFDKNINWNSLNWHGEGSVGVRFTLDTLGTAKNIKITKSLCIECDIEVLRVITIMPKWKPSIDAKSNRPKETIINQTIKFHTKE